MINVSVCVLSDFRAHLLHWTATSGCWLAVLGSARVGCLAVTLWRTQERVVMARYMLLSSMIAATKPGSYILIIVYIYIYINIIFINLTTNFFSLCALQRCTS